MSSKDVRQLVKRVKAQGFDVTPAKNGHLRVTKKGVFVTMLPGTPSDWRSLKNCMADLKRHGYIP
ncbi:hypothetical protein [Streptomyces sp. NPDC059071]|uniref:hypothetical protein n=1 Tax=unclassified Streptomyces TaxID=2593676 RepID=UPI00364C6E72